MEGIKELYRYRAMLWSLIVSELRTRYKGSFLGFLWTFVNPLLMLLVYSTVFSTVLRFNIPHYVVFLFIGLLSWNLFSTSLQSSASVIIRQSSLVKKIYFPRAILPISVVGGSVINYVLSMVILIPFLLISGFPATLLWFNIPLVLLAEVLFTSGLAMLFAVANVFFRDLEHMLGIILMAWFYITPVFYSMNMIPREYRAIYYWNPMSEITLYFQGIFYYHDAHALRSLPWFLLVACAAMVVGWVVFNRFSRRFAEEV